MTSLFDGLFALLIKFKNYRTFEKAFNERRKLPPQIILTNKEIFDENDNKENNNNNNNKIEYEYGSWEDGTDFNLNTNNHILICHFNFTIILDNDTRDNLANFKNNLGNKETTDDNNEQKDEIYYEHLLVPNFNENEICILNPANSKDKLFIFQSG